VGFSAKAGLSDAQVQATLRATLEVACWTARDKLLLQLCDALTIGTQVSDALWAALSAEYSEEALIELLLVNGFYRTISVLTNTLQMPLEDFAARFPA
jgi:alkylhydroperoxidase family enzyme